MLPSIGYFSGIPCVFHSDGGCNRPHCHFRHVDQDVEVAPQHGTAGTGTKQNHQGFQPFDSGSTQNSWSPARIIMVTKLVENAVDKALQSDLRKAERPPRATLVRNTLDRLFADPEALKMASRKKSRQVQSLPSYKPTPISKLHKHIPVSCVPEKPYASLARSRAHVNNTENPAFNWQSGLIAKSKFPQNNLLPTSTSENNPGILATDFESNSGGMNNHGQKEHLSQGFHKSHTETGFDEDCKLKMRCSIPLQRLTKADFEKYKLNKLAIANIENSRVETKPSKKTTPKIIPPSERVSNHEMPCELRKIPGTDKPSLQNEASLSLANHAKARNCKASDPPMTVDGEPPMKKNKLGLANETINLHVSSSEDPFSRWMKNKKIRQILKKDDCLKNSKQKQTAPSQTLKRPSEPEISNIKELPLEEELPEPKIAKRVAHKIDQYRPVPISAEDVKIPSSLRHHYCAAFFDEFKKIMTPEEAKRKALDGELQAAKNSKTTKTYKNNCTLLIVKFRKGNLEDGNLRQVKPELTPASCPGFTYGWSLYKSFSMYLLRENELRENGFPLALRSKPNCAFVDRASRRYSVQQPEKPFHKVCTHCSKEFVIDKTGMPTTKDDCFYHWGKLRKIQYKGQLVEKFTCCGGSVESSACEFSVYHVWSGKDEDCMEDFLETKKLPSNMEDHEAGIYALDCEMCYTTQGLELARLTVLDLNARVVFDEVIALGNPVLNYCTRFSGIDAHKVASATHTFDDVRRWIMEHFYDKTILIGHSLENDLKALKLIHRKIVDTSVTFPHKFGPPNKMSLKHLAAVVLATNIQENVDGHDSKEDAATCLQLMMKKIQDDSKARKPRVIIGYNGKKK